VTAPAVHRFALDSAARNQLVGTGCDVALFLQTWTGVIQRSDKTRRVFRAGWVGEPKGPDSPDRAAGVLAIIAIWRHVLPALAKAKGKAQQTTGLNI